MNIAHLPLIGPTNDFVLDIDDIKIVDGSKVEIFQLEGVKIKDICIQKQSDDNLWWKLDPSILDIDFKEREDGKYEFHLIAGEVAEDITFDKCRIVVTRE